MRKFGVIGTSLAHSFSPGLFGEKFKSEPVSNTHQTLPTILRV
jgi:shikimate 5-dehydrogenase